MLIYDNEYETKENKDWTKDKIALQHIQHMRFKKRQNCTWQPDLKEIERLESRKTVNKATIACVALQTIALERFCGKVWKEIEKDAIGLLVFNTCDPKNVRIVPDSLPVKAILVYDESVYVMKSTTKVYMLWRSQWILSSHILQFKIFLHKI